MSGAASNHLVSVNSQAPPHNGVIVHQILDCSLLCDSACLDISLQDDIEGADLSHISMHIACLPKAIFKLPSSSRIHEVAWY